MSMCECVHVCSCVSAGVGRVVGVSVRSVACGVRVYLLAWDRGICDGCACVRGCVVGVV